MDTKTETISPLSVEPPPTEEWMTGRYEWTVPRRNLAEPPVEWAADRSGLWRDGELIGFPVVAQQILRLDCNRLAAIQLYEETEPHYKALAQRVEEGRAERDGLRADLAVSEARGRQYCLELAEKAGEIRELEAVQAAQLGKIKRQEEELEHVRLGARCIADKFLIVGHENDELRRGVTAEAVLHFKEMERQLAQAHERLEGMRGEVNRAQGSAERFRLKARRLLKRKTFYAAEED